MVMLDVGQELLLAGPCPWIWSESRPYPRGPPRLELRNQRKLPWRPACRARYIIRTLHYAHPARATPGAHAAPPPALIGPKMASKQPSSRRSFDPPRSELRRLYQTYSMQEIAEHYGVGETMGGRVPKTGRLYLQYSGTPFVLPSSATGGSHLGNSGSNPLGYLGYGTRTFAFLESIVCSIH